MKIHSTKNWVINLKSSKDSIFECERYNKDYKLKSYGSISGKNADAILEDYESR